VRKQKAIQLLRECVTPEMNQGHGAGYLDKTLEKIVVYRKFEKVSWESFCYWVWWSRPDWGIEQTVQELGFRTDTAGIAAKEWRDYWNASKTQSGAF